MNYDKVFDAEVGEFYDISHYNEIITESCFGYKANGEVLFCFIKGAIKPENRRKYADFVRGGAKIKTKNRGASGGNCDLRYFPRLAVALCDRYGNEYHDDKKRYSVYYKDKDGKVMNRCQSNMTRSGVAGYFDKVAGLPCRKVGWSNREPLKHEGLIGLAKEIEENHKKYCPESYAFHKECADKCLEGLLFRDTIYSTMTLNYDFRTACHIDKGDLQGGLSTLTIFEDYPKRGVYKKNYTGFYTGLPEYKICFDVRDGDTLIFDAHEKHANTEFEVLSNDLKFDNLADNHHAGRMSVVCYLRNRLHECSEIG